MTARHVLTLSIPVVRLRDGTKNGGSSWPFRCQGLAHLVVPLRKDAFLCPAVVNAASGYAPVVTHCYLYVSLNDLILQPLDDVTYRSVRPDTVRIRR